MLGLRLGLRLRLGLGVNVGVKVKVGVRVQKQVKRRSHQAFVAILDITLSPIVNLLAEGWAVLGL